MRAILLSRFGPPEVLIPTELAEPQAGPGQALIEVEFASITFVETQVRAGRPPTPALLPTLPTIPGNGVGGIVLGVGAGVEPALVGTRVVTSTGGSGGYAERVAVDLAGVIAVPPGLGLAQAVALLADGRTALALMRLAAVQPRDTVLVEAAAGGVGSLLVQLGANAEARVVAAAAGSRKLALARELGAHVTIDYTDATWPARVRTQTEGVDVVFDGVGGAIGADAFGLVRGGGRFCPFGLASGTWAEISDDEASRRGVSVLRTWRMSPAEALELTRAALTEAAAGRLRPVIGQTFPLERAADAHAAIEARATLGKTLLAVSPPARKT
jgi:NADPH2:quinone reductase